MKSPDTTENVSFLKEHNYTALNLLVTLNDFNDKQFHLLMYIHQTIRGQHSVYLQFFLSLQAIRLIKK